MTIKLLYIVLLTGFILLEKCVSEKENYRGLVLALLVFSCGFLISPQMFWIGIITGGFNLARFCIVELRLMKLTALQDRLADVIDFEARTN